MHFVLITTSHGHGHELFLIHSIKSDFGTWEEQLSYIHIHIICSKSSLPLGIILILIVILDIHYSTKIHRNFFPLSFLICKLNFPPRVTSMAWTLLFREYLRWSLGENGQNNIFFFCFAFKKRLQVLGYYVPTY